MDTLFKVVALDDTINSDSAHYELEMDTRRSVNEEEQTLHNPFRDIKLAGRSIPTISSTIISTYQQ